MGTSEASGGGTTIGGVALPWRGPGPERPAVPLPPGPMPLRSAGQLRKRWRYIAAFADDLMLCAARVQVGPFGQTFWVVWDREKRQRLAHTSIRPGGREVRMDGPRIEIAARGVRAQLTLGDSAPIETICPSGSAWGWTRKRAGMSVTGTIEIDGVARPLEALGVDDESAGYHQRHTDWLWSAGVGSAADGRPLAWNLVTGINDPPSGSERAVWLDGVAHEPDPVTFRGLDAIEFGDGPPLLFSGECERANSDNLLLIRSRYRLRFGSFSGSLAGTELADGLGVMEEHSAVW